MEAFINSHPGWQPPIGPNGTGFPTHAIPPNCTGIGNLQAAGLWPVRFGGISGYFAILLGYMLLFAVSAYLALKLSLRSVTRDN